MTLFSSVVERSALLIVLVGVAVGGLGCDGGGSSAEPPAAPSDVRATSEDGAVALTWEASAEASAYNVYRDTSPVDEVEGTPVNGDTPVNQVGYTDESAENGTRYYYRVTAVGEGGESTPSSEVSARPFPSPPDDHP